MWVIAICVLFLIPAYYLARSKGYNLTPVLITSGSIGLFVPLIILTFPNLNLQLPGLILTATPLFIAWILPVKENAPGKRYLSIRFDCPECAEMVKFSRAKEGTAVLCPKCGEIITVPIDEFSLKTPTEDKEKPTVSSGSVCFAHFGDEMAAQELLVQLRNGGINAEFIDGTGSGMLPQFAGTQGFKIEINIADWDKAVEIKREIN